MADVEGFATSVASLARQCAKCQVQHILSNNHSSSFSLIQGSSAETMVPPTPEKQYAKALYSYTPHSSREVAIKRGDILVVINSSNKEWWKVESGGKQGFVPANYLQKVDKQLDSSGLAGNGEQDQNLVALKQGTIERKYNTTVQSSLMSYCIYSQICQLAAAIKRKKKEIGRV